MNANRPLGRVGFIQSCWHKDLVDQTRSAFVAESSHLGLAESEIDFSSTRAFRSSQPC